LIKSGPLDIQKGQQITNLKNIKIMEIKRFDYTLDNGINDCVYYDVYLEISWKQVVEDIQSIADEYGAEIVSIERYN
jgi:hypothetical protein